MNVSRKRALFLSYNFPPKLGGQEQVIWEVWKKLSERSEAVAIVQAGAGVGNDFPRVYPAPREGLFPFFRHILGRGNKLTRSERFDVIVASNGLVAWAAQHLARQAGSESAGIFYGLDTIHSSWLYQTMIKRALPRLDRILAISHATAQETLKRGVRSESLQVIFPGCHAEPYLQKYDSAELKRRWDLEDSPVILSAGRLVPRKGMDRFIRECFPKILERVPNTTLLLAGGNPEGALAHRTDMSKQVQTAIEETGLRERVRVTGRLADKEMVEAFQVSDVVTLPVVPIHGEMEGFGIVLLEAAAAGKPTVASRIGGIPDAVEEGVTGFLADPLDYDSMADRIVELLLDREKARVMGEAGRNRVIENFQWTQVADRYVDFLLGESGTEDHLS